MRDVVLGYTSFEVSITQPAIDNRLIKYKERRLPRVTQTLCPMHSSPVSRSNLVKTASRIVSKAYAIPPTMDQNLFLTSPLQWVGDAVFDAPAHILATHLSTKTNKNVYRYIFNVRNPFPNHALYQQLHHWVNLYFVFKAYQFWFPYQRLKSISTKQAQL